MTSYQLGRDIPIDRTIELNASAYTTKLPRGVAPSPQLKTAMESNGADNILWTTGDKVYLSSGRWNQLKGPVPQRGDTIQFGSQVGTVLAFDGKANTEDEALAHIAQKYPGIPTNCQIKPDDKAAHRERNVGAFVGTMAGISAGVKVGEAVAQRVTADTVPKLLRPLASKLPAASGIATGIAVAGLVGYGLYKGLKHLTETGKADVERDCKQILEKAKQPPDYDKASRFGKVIPQ